MKTYRVDHRKFYRKGIYYVEGDIVTLPDDERVPSSLHLIEETPNQTAKAAEKPVVPPAKKAATRAADADPAKM